MIILCWESKLAGLMPFFRQKEAVENLCPKLPLVHNSLLSSKKCKKVLGFTLCTPNISMLMYVFN